MNAPTQTLNRAQQVLRYDVAEVRPVSLRDIRLAEREQDRDARQLQQQARYKSDIDSEPALSPNLTHRSDVTYTPASLLSRTLEPVRRLSMSVV